MANKYLNATGLAYFWTKVKAWVQAQGYKTTDTNTTYSLNKSGSTITLTGSDGQTTSITDSNTTYEAATTSTAGLMSASDKSKLDGIASGATVVTVDSELNSTSTNPVQNKIIKAELDKKAASSHTHNYAGSSSAGGAATTALTCTGNSATATKATQDANGNIITSTYATKTELGFAATEADM